MRVADEACTYITERQGPLNFVISAAYGAERARPQGLCTFIEENNGTESPLIHLGTLDEGMTLW
jgi:hypothetical protein